MPVYSFEALTAEGQSRKGVIDADSAKAARGMLRAQALVPIKLETVGAEAAQLIGKNGLPQQGGRRRHG